VSRSRSRRKRRPGPQPARLTTLAWLGLAGFGLLAARAFQLQSLDAERLRELAEAQSHTKVKLDVARGALRDRSGSPLAVTAPVESIAASPRRIEDRERTASVLAHALGRPASHVGQRLDPRRAFAWVERWVDPERAARVRALDLEGIRIHRERRRYYPRRELAAAYLGFVGRDGTGLTGLELRFDELLSGRAGDVPALRDAAGRRLPLWDGRDRVQPGRDVELALDGRLQAFAQLALDRAVDHSRARHGTLVALEPHTGELLAVAESPSFDPNRFWEQPQELFRARAFVEPFEPGSTLKPFSIAVALEAGNVRPQTAFDCENGSWRVLNRRVRDHKPFGVLSVRDILRFSSNIGVAKVAERVGSAELVAGLRRFGFGVRPGSGFPGEAAGTLHRLRQAQAVERANLAFGQGISVTPVQLAVATAILANGGRRVTPRLLRVRPDVAAAPAERVISRATARTVVDMLRGAVESGTGRAAALPHHSVAGKTGTAQKVIDGTYSHEQYVASFIGIVPAVNPRMVLVVVLDEPRGVHTGGAVAAPVFREVAGFAVEQLALPAEGAE
jgi:cell division protein FtsI (penicillin-binding protein 3)